MTIKVYKCKRCGERIYSRSHYDYMTCKCGHLSIDGGPIIEGDENAPLYNRIMGLDYEPQLVTIDGFESIREFKYVLFNDYNTRKNKYGRIK